MRNIISSALIASSLIASSPGRSADTKIDTNFMSKSITKQLPGEYGEGIEQESDFIRGSTVDILNKTYGITPEMPKEIVDEIHKFLEAFDASFLQLNNPELPLYGTFLEHANLCYMATNNLHLSVYSQNTLQTIFSKIAELYFQKVSEGTKTEKQGKIFHTSSVSEKALGNIYYISKCDSGAESAFIIGLSGQEVSLPSDTTRFLFVDIFDTSIKIYHGSHQDEISFDMK